MRYVGLVIDDWCWEVEDKMHLYSLMMSSHLNIECNEVRKETE